MSRKLASIQIIKKINSIENADRISCAEVLGWNCVIQKGQFTDGEKVIYVEVDSFLPIKSEFEFLRKSCYKKMHTGEEGFRIKTIRLKGQISQGLILPTNILPDGTYRVGDDVTEKLGIIQWQSYIPPELKGKMKGNFPPFIPKTDETRVKVLQDVLTRHINTLCYISEKIDGTSVTYYVKDGVFGVCGRNVEYIVDDTNTYCEIARKFNIREKLLSLHCNIAIQGEIFGMWLQGNPLKLHDVQVRFFNIFDIDKYEYLEYSKFMKTLSQLELSSVPILNNDFLLTDKIDEL